MSDNRVIRINKVLRELNISLDRAVDFLKEKNHVIESSPNAKISQEEYNVLCSQFSADKGKKVASLEVSEEKKKEKEALKKELEKEQELKRQQEAEAEKQRQEVIKAKAVVEAPKPVGKIDLNPKKVEVKKQEKEAEVTPAETKKSDIEKVAEEAPKKDKTNKPKVEVSKKEVSKVSKENESSSTESTEEEKITTNYQKLSGTTFTGQKIDLSQFNKPKKKKEDNKGVKKADDKSGANKGKRKRITKPVPGAKPGAANTQAGGAKKSFSKDSRFSKGKKVVVQKTEPTEEEVKNQIKETLERLQGKGKKGSKAAKYRKDKRDSHRQRVDDELEQKDL